MADLATVCSEIFFGNTHEFEGPFFRELAVKHPTKTVDPGAVFADVKHTPRYRRFLKDKVTSAVTRLIPAGADSDIFERLVEEGVQKFDPHTPDTIDAAIREDAAWRDFVDARIDKVSRMCGIDLSADQIVAIRMQLADDVCIDAVRTAIEACVIVKDSPTPAPPVSVPEMCPPPAAQPPEIDEAWLAAFEDAYARDALVHEYVLLRKLPDPDPAQLYPLHVEAYERFQDMHRCYLNEHLCESDFVKRFVPAALLDPGLVDVERDAILTSEEYKINMCTRLDAVHRALFGEALLEADALFERRVKAERLTLQSERLNEIVMEFSKETEALSEIITSVYLDCLRREPDSWEVASQLPAFRVDVSAGTRALKDALVSSLEFQDVLKNEIRAQASSLSNAKLFKVLEAVLQLDLKNMKASDAVTRALQSENCT